MNASQSTKSNVKASSGCESNLAPEEQASTSKETRQATETDDENIESIKECLTSMMKKVSGEQDEPKSEGPAAEQAQTPGAKTKYSSQTSLSDTSAFLFVETSVREDVIIKDDHDSTLYDQCDPNGQKKVK